MKRDRGRFHLLWWGGGQITISRDLARELPFKNKNKVLIEYDKEKEALLFTEL